MTTRRRLTRERIATNKKKRLLWLASGELERLYKERRGSTPAVYDRRGQPMPYRWYLRKSAVPTYRNVALNFVGQSRVSTIWLGLDHGFGDELPLIFETMIFSPLEINGYCARYATEEEALEGHRSAVLLTEVETHNARAAARKKKLLVS